MRDEEAMYRDLEREFRFELMVRMMSDDLIDGIEAMLTPPRRRWWQRSRR